MRVASTRWCIVGFVTAMAAGCSSGSDGTLGPGTTVVVPEQRPGATAADGLDPDPGSDGDVEDVEDVEGLGRTEIADGVGLDVELQNWVGDPFDPGQDVKFRIVVAIDGLDVGALVDLVVEHDAAGTPTTSTPDTVVLDEPPMDGILVVQIPNPLRERFSAEAIGTHTLEIRGTISSNADADEPIDVERTIRFRVTADAAAQTIPLSFVDGAISVDLSRRWWVESMARFVDPYVEDDIGLGEVPVAPDDSDSLVHLRGRAAEVVITRQRRPLLLPPPDELARQLPSVVGPGELAEPGPVTVGGIDGVRVSGDGRFVDLVRVGREYLVVSTSYDDDDGRREAEQLLASMTLDGAAFPPLTHRAAVAYSFDRGDGRSVTVRVPVPADVVPVDHDGPAIRLVDPSGELVIEVAAVDPAGRPLEELVAALAASVAGPDGTFTVEQGRPPSGLRRDEASVSSPELAAELMVFGDPIAAHVVLVVDRSAQPDVDLLDAVIDRVRIEVAPM